LKILNQDTIDEISEIGVDENNKIVAIINGQNYTKDDLEESSKDPRAAKNKALFTKLINEVDRLQKLLDDQIAAISESTTTTPVSDTKAKKADIERRRQEELTELGQKQLTKGFNTLSEATKPEQVANAIVNIEQNKNQGARLSKEQEQQLSEAKAKLNKEGYEIVDYNIVRYGENTIVESVDFYNSEKDVLTEEQANAIESKINSLEKRGEEVHVDDLPSPVSRTIKPLIKKDGVMVQAAKVNTLIFESVEQAREAIKKSREAGNKKPNAADKINAKYDAELAASATPASNIEAKIAEGTNSRGTTYKGETTEKDGLKVTEYSEFRPDGKRISKGGRIMSPSEFIEEYNITDQDYLDSLEGATEIRVYQVRVGKRW